MKNPIGPFLLLNAAWAIASAATDADCAKAQAGLAKGVAGVLCMASADLTTANPATTPPDDSLTGLPPGAFVPRADSANQASVSPLGRYAVTKRVSGVQLAGAMAANSGARWVIRIPDDWNGRLIVAVAAGTRSEYQPDLSVSDYAVQNGYAYAATNKGHLARRATTPDDPLGCPGSPTGGPGATSYTRQYQSDLGPEDAFAAWARSTLETARLAKMAVLARHGRQPAFTYLTGLSAGGLVTRHLLEANPGEFDGGIDRSSPYLGSTGNGHRKTVPLLNNLVGLFSAAMRPFSSYVTIDYSQTGESMELLASLGMPPDMFGAPSTNSPRGSYLETHYNAVWMGLQCGNVRASDPTFDGDISEYRYWERGASPAASLRKIATTGDLKRPLISVHGTMDATAPILSSRMYRSDVVSQGRAAMHRLYEVQNGTHRDAYRDLPLGFTAVEYMMPHYAAAFDALVRWVETGEPPYPSQCIPRGGSPTMAPAASRCTALLVP